MQNHTFSLSGAPQPAVASSGVGRSFTALRMHMYTFVVNSGFIFTHLLNVSEKYSSICIFHLQPNQPVTTKATIPEKTVVADIVIPTHVYTAVLDVHVSERAEHTTVHPVSRWTPNTEHLQFTVAMEKLYEWLRSKVTSSDQLQFVFYCWGEKNLIQMYSVSIVHIPIVHKALKQGAKRAALFHAPLSRDGGVHGCEKHSNPKGFVLHRPQSTSVSESPVSGGGATLGRKRKDGTLGGASGVSRAFVPPTEPIMVDVRQYDYNTGLDAAHFHRLVHRWHEGLIDENDEELDEKHFHVPRKGKKGPKAMESEVDEDEEEEEEERDEGESQKEQNDEDEEDEEEKNNKRNGMPVQDKPTKRTKNVNGEGMAQGKAKPKPKPKTKKQHKTPKEKELRPLLFLSRPFVDRFLFIPSAFPQQSSVTLRVSTSEFHSICRDLALGGNVVNMMPHDRAFFMSTSGEPGVVAFEFRENRTCTEVPRVPDLFQPPSPPRHLLSSTDSSVSSGSALSALGVPSWFEDLRVPASFSLCHTPSWSHLPTFVRQLESLCVVPLPSRGKEPSENNVNAWSESDTTANRIHPFDVDHPRSPNLQSCYSLDLVPPNGHSSPPFATRYLLRLLKMCTKEFSSKSLSSFPSLQLSFTPGRFLVLSLLEPVMNHGMSIHVYISPVS